ncbi:uncharacterized protein PAC_00215 [Phialocephala subalpina]|uniref:Uncharacterized protein n=1 Tax=Phialocephala subalpina TaxID=576137 RepID=A0A1L7WC23_9HELO|nr:uncharacterized protein PAC_00215 [Phialocephala subalpina]
MTLRVKVYKQMQKRVQIPAPLSHCKEAWVRAQIHESRDHDHAQRLKVGPKAVLRRLEGYKIVLWNPLCSTRRATGMFSSLMGAGRTKRVGEYEMLRGLGIILWVKDRIIKSRELAKGGE